MAAIRPALLVLLCLGAWAQDPAARPYWRTIVQGTHGMVAAEHPLQAMAGLDALKAGGNAVDAALAAFYMTAVVEQHQAVYAPLKDVLATGELHALALKTYSQNAWKKLLEKKK